ncbi:MAG: dephospho-CoA kinase [Anaerolineae bacterium]|nr:dephospho-CoA kinase [Anaerolineae bacterium]MDW8070125.1 dephospho-CoA kinase [Anaerolineae bacterium]
MNTESRKYVIGLTGGIATGKTLVLRMLKELGAYTIDADDLAHILMRRGGPLYQPIITEFGRYVLDENSEIDRGKLGEIVFASPRALAHLEAITHPVIIAVIRRLIGQAKADVVAIEAIKLVESGLAKECNAVWVVTARPDVQLNRLMTKRRLSSSQALLRLEAQPPQEAWTARADVVIDNSGDILETWKTVQRHFATIPRAAAPTVEAAHTAEVTVMPELTPVELLRQLRVRRARRNDLAEIAALIAHATHGERRMDEVQMMERFFSKGYFLADAGGQLLGIMGLHTENLIATLDDCMVRSATLWPIVGKALLEAVEEDARQLSCEVMLAFLRPEAGPMATILFEKHGFIRQRVEEISIKMWREAAEQYSGDGSVLMVKRLLEHQIMRPI